MEFTKEQLTDKRLAKILSETQASINEHNAHCITGGSVEVNARLFESMLMEIQFTRQLLSNQEQEPVILYRERNPYNGQATGWQELTKQGYEFIKANPGENAEFKTLYTAPQLPMVSAAEKLNAELEVREVTLPAAWWVKQGFQSFLAYEKQLLLDALNDAGISIKGEN